MIDRTMEKCGARLTGELTRLGLTAAQCDSPRYTRLHWLCAQRLRRVNEEVAA